MSAHTPGPWIVRDGIVCKLDVEANKYADAIPLAGAWIEGAWQDGDATPESIANAKLCAAAPELIEACKALMGAEEEHDPFAKGMLLGCAYEIARAAVAKAEGRQ